MLKIKFQSVIREVTETNKTGENQPILEKFEKLEINRNAFSVIGLNRAQRPV